MAKRLPNALVLLALLVSSVGALAVPAVFAATSTSGTCAASSLPSSTFVAAPPTGATGPDDITTLTTHGHQMIWVAYQNGINPDGTPGTPGGPIQSTVAGYDMSTGALVKTILVTGKVDGLTAWPALGMLIATVNEDDNSRFNLVNPLTGAVITYTYNPNPAVNGVGGTDSIAVHGMSIYVSHSNPSDTTQATQYLVILHPLTLTADLKPVFFDDSSATDVNTGSTVQMALTDPDTNYMMPHAGEAFGGDLATISQGDGKIIFAAHPEVRPALSVLSVTDNVVGNAPPLDGLAVATSGSGTLFVVDNKANTISALNTSGCSAGTVFVGEASDNSNPLLGTLNLSTGQITVLGNSFQNPHGILFVPSSGTGS